MMTPLGRGGAMYPQRRRWPRVLAIVASVLLIAGAGVGIWWWLGTGDAPEVAPETAKQCRTPTPRLPQTIPPPNRIRVTVSNGTDRAGLASQTATVLEGRGFIIAGVENTDRPVTKGVGVVRYGERGYPAAIRLASFVPDTALTPVAKLNGPTVQLWLGPEFTEVIAPDQADVAAVVLPPEEPICRKK